jgi:hypothetical protein
MKEGFGMYVGLKDILELNIIEDNFKEAKFKRRSFSEIYSGKFLDRVEMAQWCCINVVFSFPKSLHRSIRLSNKSIGKKRSRHVIFT